MNEGSVLYKTFCYRAIWLILVCASAVSCFKESLPQELLMAETGLSLHFPYTGGEQSFKISSNTVWSIGTSDLPEWLVCGISQLEGEGDAVITVSLGENSSRLPLEYILTIFYGSKSISNVHIYYDCIPNHSPTAPQAVLPKDGAVKLSVIPYFEWTASRDADQDELFYNIVYSVNKTDWDTSAVTKSTNMDLSSILAANTRYYYKICASDMYGGACSSPVYSFTTGIKDAYAPGEYKVYMKSAKKNPVNLIFMGDGYTSGAFRYNGVFDTNVDEGIEAFFSVEPYRSYRSYFTVYKVAAYSAEPGLSITGKGVVKNTAFSSVLLEGTNVSCNYDKVLEYACKIPGINDKVLKESGVVLLINEDVYAGTCAIWSDGKSLAMVPVCKKNGGFLGAAGFGGVINHEAGGHGWGRLADEYVNNEGTAPQEKIQSLAKWQNDYNAYKNVSFTSVPSSVPWSSFIGRAGYEQVAVFEGGMLYRYGFYRSEQYSCMVDNRKYFNAQSRYLIVKRIIETAGEVFSFARFLANDVADKNRYYYSATKTEGVIPYRQYVPLAPPVLIEE